MKLKDLYSYFDMMNTLVESTDPDNKAIPTNSISLGNHTYFVDIKLHKGDQHIDEGTPINPLLVQSFVAIDDITKIFPTFELVYESRFGMNVERISPEAYYSEKSGLMKKEPYAFSEVGSDYIYIFIKKIKNENEDDHPQEAIVNTDFVILNKTESTLFNTFDNANSTVTKLTLMPRAEWELGGFYPQWTTGYDEDKEKKSGKATGVCVKELLELAEMRINQNFNVSGPTINMTSLVSESCLDLIKKIMKLHSNSDQNFDPAFLRYDVVENDFSLESIQDLITKLQEFSETSAYLQFIIKSHSYTDQVGQQLGLMQYGSNVITKAESSFESYDIVNPFALVSRHNSSFVIDATQYDVADKEKQIKDKYYNEPVFGYGMDSSKLVRNFIKESPPINFYHTPHWRESERKSMSNDILFRKWICGQKIKFSVPGYGNENRVGRKFNVRMFAGAIDEFTKLILGTYVITETKFVISMHHNYYNISIAGVKPFMAKEMNFSTENLENP